MWGWIISAGAASLLWLLSDGEEKKRTNPRTKLERRFRSLKREIKKSDGCKIAVLGQPGAGKSSLVDGLSLGKCVPPPKISVETDATDWSGNASFPLTHRVGNVCFVDTPGYDTIKHPVSSYRREFPIELFDRVILVFSGKLRSADEEMILWALHEVGAQKTLLVRSFAESLNVKDRQEVASDFEPQLAGWNAKRPLFFVSNRTKAGIDKLRRELELAI